MSCAASSRHEASFACNRNFHIWTTTTAASRTFPRFLPQTQSLPQPLPRLRLEVAQQMQRHLKRRAAIKSCAPHRGQGQGQGPASTIQYPVPSSALFWVWAALNAHLRRLWTTKRATARLDVLRFCEVFEMRFLTAFELIPIFIRAAAAAASVCVSTCVCGCAF